MFSKFLNLDTEKQDRIMNAAMKEFALKGYDRASTNEIVKDAGISKGLLFHYFGNKKQLFLFLYEHMTKIFLERILEKVNWDEKDIFFRYRQIASLKLELFKIYPEMFNFIKSIYTEASSDVKSDLNRMGKELFASSFLKLFSDIDTSKFKQGIDINKAINVINWTLEGFAYQQQEKAIKLNLEQINNEEALAEMDVYMEMLKHSFYE
ncbi:MAG: TetR/AcrR family transcriptional regulator [Bacillus sp. (in: Bacteria)]|nr:TetR/AcrR family transcriptional regulator [Bacillus sp. (in: firmicutes)]